MNSFRLLLHATGALQMLRDDHARITILFTAGEQLADDSQALERVVRKACAELLAHARLEDEFFYPALRGASDERLLDEAQVEHHVAARLIEDLAALDAADERYRATFKVLGSYVKHHIDEEERTIFPLARVAMTSFDALCEALSVRPRIDIRSPDLRAADPRPLQARTLRVRRARPRSGAHVRR